MSRFSASMTFALVLGLGWAIAASAALGVSNDAPLALVGWLLLAIVTGVVLAVRLRYVGMVAAVAAWTAFFALSLVQAAHDKRALPAGVPLLSLLIAGAALLATPFVLGVLLAEVEAMAARIHEQYRAIDELTVLDASTGAFRPRYIDTILPQEIDRARRYHRSLTLAIVAADDWAAVIREQGDIAAHSLNSRIVERLSQGTRTVDKIIQLGDGEFAVVLPETPLEGAEIVAARVQATTAAETGLMLRVGLANFPRDAVMSAPLLHEARAALGHARRTGLLVVDRTLLDHSSR